MASDLIWGAADGTEGGVELSWHVGSSEGEEMALWGGLLRAECWAQGQGRRTHGKGIGS